MSGDILARLGGFGRGRTPVIIQTEAAECGLACMAMVAGRHGYRTDLPALRRRFAASLKGMTLRDLIRLGSAMDMATRAVRLDLPELTQLRLPCILHWNHNHFVVLTRVTAKDVEIHDPALGRRRVPMAEVSQRFTGVALEAWPTEQFQRRNERARISITDLVKRTAGIGRAVIQVLAISLLLEAVAIAMPIGFQIVLDEVVVAADYDLLTLIAIGLGGLLLLQVGATFVRSWVTMILGSSLVLQWKVSLFDHLMRLPLGFFEKRHVGDVVSRFGSLDSIQRTLTTGAMTAVLDGVMAFALAVMMYVYGDWLVFVALGAMALYVAIRIAAFAPYRAMSEEAIVHAAQENSHFMETVRGIASLKALNLEPRRRAVWINHLADRVSADVRVQKFDVIFKAAGGLLFGVDRILMIYLGARAILAGDMSIGMLIAFLAYKDQFTTRVNAFVDTAMQLRMLSLHGERIADIALAEAEDSDRPAETLALPAPGQPLKPGALTLEGVHFRYADTEPEVLRGISLTVTPGECLGIAGPSGTGKTTLVKIMAGLAQPTEGRVLLDGVPATAIGMATFRTRVGCVLQEDRLFAGSIADNISGFDSAADPAWVQACAMMAAIHEDILRMPMAYETLVGDMGSALSAGQRQRVIMARALYRRPTVLLLDEATSHLDPDNEALINQAVKQLPITRIVIAHRPSSLAVADRVLQLLPPQPAGAPSAAAPPAGPTDTTTTPPATPPGT